MPKKSKFSFPVNTLAGSRVSNLINICKQHKIDNKYKGKLVLTAAVSGIFEALSAYEEQVTIQKINNYQLDEPPIFIIGFWRSGTTLLHNLLCQDSAAAYTTTFQSVFPNLALTQNKWLKPLANYIGPAKRPFDNVSMDMDFPQEEEFGLMNLQPHSIYKFFLFPKQFDKIVHNDLFTEKLPDIELNNWKYHYNKLVMKSILNTGRDRFVSKNPCNITRINVLKQMYPGARFIFIYRNPYKVIESLYRFVMGIFPGVQLQGIPSDFGRKNIALMYDVIMRHYLKEREQLSQSELIEIRMEDFITDIDGGLRDIYDHFGLNGYDQSRSKFEDYLSKNPAPRKISYPVEEETINLVNAHLADIVKTLGYEKKSCA